MAVRATRVRRLRIRRAIGRTSFGVLVLASGMLYLGLQKSVTLVVDGRPEVVRTMSGNVGQLLADHGVSVTPGTDVEPPPATSISDGMVVVVSSQAAPAGSQQVQAPQAPTGVGVWVTEGVSGSSLRTALRAENEFSAGRAAGSSRVVAARVVVMGKEHDVLTNAATARALLSAMGINPDGNDRVLPSPSTPLHPGATVRFRAIRYRIQHVETVIPFATYTTYSSSLAPGVERVDQAGRPGVLLRKFRVKVVDGRVASRRLRTQRVVQSAVPERRVLGRAPAAPSPASPTSGTEVGEASWYDAPGSGLTAAHPWLPYGTRVTVRDLDNGRSVTVVINDRGPFGGRIIDLSPEAFSTLAPLSQGVANVRLTW